MSSDETLSLIAEKITRLEAAVSLLVEQHTVKDFYTVEEAAVILRRRPYTIREHCRLGRINATKRESGRGEYGEWSISRDELTHVMTHGVRPLPA
jgi:hypothetical protein